MPYAYLGSNVISLAIWLVLYYARSDLRKMMVVMSVCAAPLAIFDLVFVPSYWVPLTLFNIPIGIEGFICSFTTGGIAAVLYAELSKSATKRLNNWQSSEKRTVWIPVLTFLAFVFAEALGIGNPELAAYIALSAGIILTIVFRPDLTINMLWGSVSFGVVYFLSLKVWAVIFPGVNVWFTFQGLPRLFVWGVPGWEALYGFFIGALWSVLYEALFGFKLVGLKNKKW